MKSTKEQGLPDGTNGLDKGASIGHGCGSGLLLVEGLKEVVHYLLKQLLLATRAQVT